MGGTQWDGIERGDFSRAKASCELAKDFSLAKQLTGNVPTESITFFAQLFVECASTVLARLKLFNAPCVPDFSTNTFGDGASSPQVEKKSIGLYLKDVFRQLVWICGLSVSSEGYFLQFSQKKTYCKYFCGWNIPYIKSKEGKCSNNSQKMHLNLKIHHTNLSRTRKKKMGGLIRLRGVCGNSTSKLP